MAHRSCVSGLLKVAAPVFGLALALSGCDGEVTTGSGNGGGGGSGGSGGQCAKYTGDGCTPGETVEVECQSPDDDSIWIEHEECEIQEGCETVWRYVDCDTPLVLSFDGAEPALFADAQHGFALRAGLSRVTDWPTAKTPWLAFDRDGSGAIEDGTELFGSMSPLASGRRATNGFAALAELDSNGDGRITPEDTSFAQLVVWADRDADRASSPAELSRLGASGVIAIDLAYSREPHCDVRGNCGVERAAFRFVDAAGTPRVGAVIDVHLAPQP